MSELDSIKNILRRERKARKEAERILELKSTELWDKNKKLEDLLKLLEGQVISKTKELENFDNTLKLLFDQHPLPMLIYTTIDARIVSVNSTAIEKYGYSEEEFKSKTVYDLHLNPKDTILNDHMSNISADKIELNENTYWEHLSKNNEIFKVETSANSILFHDKKARLVLIQDVTDKVLAEQKIKDSEYNYRMLVESSSDMIYRVDKEGNIKYANPRTINFTGFSEEELYSMKFFDLIANEYKSKIYQYYIRQIKNNIEESYLEFPCKNKHNVVAWIGQSFYINFKDPENIEITVNSRDITERKIAEIALQKSEDKYRSIIENLELGLLEVNNDDVITKAYPKFCELSGYNEKELIGKKALEFLIHEDSKEQMIFENKIRKKGKASVYEIKLICKDGTIKWVLISGAPFYNRNNELEGTVGVHLDITIRKQMEQDLIITKNNAIKGAKEKELFLAKMSHEIRTPMNGIIGMAELISQTELTNQQTEYLSAIQISSQNLLHIINEILDLSKISNSKIDIVEREFNLIDLIKSLEKTFIIKATEKSLDLNFEIQEGISKYIIADNVRINQILINLLNNAVKFTKKGHVTTKLTLIEDSETYQIIEFKIQDTGIGINESDKQFVFEEFKQANKNIENEFGGTGLGLPICKNLVKFLGGELKLNSTYGKGSEFFFEIPIKKNVSENKISKKIKKLLTIDKKYHVLVVDDNEVNLLLVTSILKNLSCSYDQAFNGKEAVDLVSKNKYDVIFMDMRMPVLNGLDATKIIRNKLKSKIHIVALSANASKKDELDCTQAGMNDFLSKPFTQNQFVSKLNSIPKEKLIKINELDFNNKKDDSDLNKQANIINLKEDKLLMLDKLNELSNDNQEFVINMLNIFITKTPEDISEMKDNLKNDNFEIVRNLAHKIKPSIDLLTNSNLKELVRSLEKNNNKTIIQDFTLFEEMINTLMTEIKIKLNSLN